MNLVPVGDIPKPEDIKEVSLDDLAEVYKICNRMKEVCEVENGLGLSAVQVGIPLKLFLVKSDKASKFNKSSDYGCFLNCEYKAGDNSEEVMSIEGCLSIKSETGKMRHFQVKRYTEVLVNGYKLNEEMELEEIVDIPIGVSEQSVVFQHEIDHHSGILISDIGQEIFLWR